MRVSPLSLTILAAVVSGPVALAQDGPRPPVPPQRTPGEHQTPPEAKPALPANPAEAKQHLQHRLEELQHHEGLIRDALKKLDEGVPVNEALRGLEARQERRPDRDGRPGEARPELRRMDGDRPPGGDGDRRDSDRRLDRPVTDEERQHVRAFLRENLPAVADKFATLEKTNPEMADRGLRRMVSRVEEAEDARERDPAFFNLKVAELDGSVSLVETIRSYRDAEATKDAAKIDHATGELRKAVTRQVETRLKLQAHEIDGLNKRVEELKADLAKKNSDKSGEIDRMVKRIQEFPQRPREQGREAGPREGQDRKLPPKQEK